MVTVHEFTSLSYKFFKHMQQLVLIATIDIHFNHHTLSNVIAKTDSASF
jgi:hypothetical protein